ncbi:P-loop containing nucleoside triphosphate hydrolase protein, partial [Usnea florida]
KQFTFNCVLAPPISTRAVFEKVEPLTQATLQGFNLYIIADGQSGSGKSYTIINGPSPIATSAITSLFTEIHRGNPDYKILMTCSILEIYKEQARDLL